MTHTDIHYDDQALFQFAEGTSPIAGEIEAHVACCQHCSDELASHRDIVYALQSTNVWSGMSSERDSQNDPADESTSGLPQSWSNASQGARINHGVQPPPKQVVMDVMAFAERAREEDALAVTLCEEVLSGPSAWWPTRLRKTEGIYSAGMVRQLLERAVELRRTSPANALLVSELATEVANELSIIDYPCDYVVKLRAQSLREEAYALSFIGRFPEALDLCDRARRLFEQVPLPEYDLARLDLVRASVLRSIDRVGEATTLARDAAETFLRFGDQSRYLTARIFEAAMVYQAADYSEASAIWESVVDNPALDDVTRLGVVHNIALCQRHLGKTEEAARSLRRCVDEYEMLGLDVERTRSRWNLGQTLVAAGRTRDGIPVLRQAWHEFEALDVLADSALVALELAEALLIEGQTAEVPAICRDIVARFTRAGMTSRAITALSFLREAVAIGQAQPSLVRHVYNFLRELPAERSRAHASSPAGLGE